MTTWFKFPTSYWDDPRMFTLRRSLGESALWIPARLWTFAAGQDGSGNLAKYQPAELAEALRYSGGKDLVAELKAAGYLDRRGRIIGWDELFSLAASRKQAAVKAAAGRWGKASSPDEEKKKGDQKREERGEAHALPDALPDGMRDASKGTLTPAALMLSPKEQSEAESELNTTAKGVVEGVKLFNQIKSNYPGDPRTSDAFKGWMRTSKHGQQVLKSHPKPRKFDIF